MFLFIIESSVFICHALLVGMFWCDYVTSSVNKIVENQLIWVLLDQYEYTDVSWPLNWLDLRVYLPPPQKNPTSDKFRWSEFSLDEKMIQSNVEVEQ